MNIQTKLCIAVAFTGIVMISLDVLVKCAENTACPAEEQTQFFPGRDVVAP